MNRSALVSVITPFLNAEEFLREAVESVHRQTYENWELWLVDDGSNDFSTELALSYARDNPTKIHYLEHEGHKNLGQGAARNLGLRQSKGEYVAFLDSDDVWLPGKLHEQVGTLTALPQAGMVCAPSIAWNSWNPDAKGAVDAVYALDGAADTLVQPCELLIRWYPLGRTTPTTSSIMLRRELINQIGGFEDATGTPARLLEDQVLFAKIYLNTAVFVGRECATRYRMHAASCCARATVEQHDAACTLFLQWLAAYLGDHGIKDPRLQRVLDRTLWRYQHPIVLDCARRAKRMLQCISGEGSARVHQQTSTLTRNSHLISSK